MTETIKTINQTESKVISALSPGEAGLKPSGSIRSRFVKICRKEPVGVIAFGVIVLLVAGAVLAPLIAPYDPLKQNYRAGEIRAAPGAAHPFGTDQYGRDILSRIIYGARTSLTVGFLSVLIGVTVGTLLGLVGGFVGGWCDAILQVGSDILQAFPALILAMAMVSVWGYGAGSTLLAIGIVLIPVTYRVVRGSTLAVRANQYIEASRAVGCRTARIIRCHILPNVLPVIIIQASIAVGLAILVEGALSFLGLGTQPPEPTWGNMLNEGRSDFERAPWMAVFPGLAISLTVLAFNLLGDALRDLLDPTGQK